MTVAVEAKEFLFVPTALSAPADKPFRIAFRNADAAIPHNITIVTGPGTYRFNGKLITGVASITYAIPAQPAGDYRLGCIVHPAMTGTLTVR